MISTTTPRSRCVNQGRFPWVRAVMWNTPPLIYCLVARLMRYNRPANGSEEYEERTQNKEENDVRYRLSTRKTLPRAASFTPSRFATTKYRIPKGGSTIIA